YGIHVARLAGVPEPVIQRAREVLAGLEAASASQRSPRAARRGPSRSQQLPLALPSPVEEALRRADLSRMTPIEALNFLSTLRTLLEAGPSHGSPQHASGRRGPGGDRPASTVIPFPSQGTPRRT